MPKPGETESSILFSQSKSTKQLTTESSRTISLPPNNRSIKAMTEQNKKSNAYPNAKN
ncbi:unnamed protein product, partial [Rotaria sp. Silwood1]